MFKIMTFFSPPLLGIPLAASFFYLISLLLQIFRIVNQWKIKTVFIWLILLTAACFHGYLLYKWIDVGEGQNLSVYNMFSLISWFIAVIAMITAFKKPMDNLIILVSPLAVVSIGLGVFFPEQYLVNTKANPFVLWHILLATLVVSVLMIAALQALLLAIQERQLRYHHPSGIVRFLPSMQTIEDMLFQMIKVGFLLLTILLGSSLLFYPLSNAVIQKKMIFSLSAWLIFLILLIGRYYAGWRGRTAIQGTLLGVFVLMLIYFGSELLINQV